MFWEKIKHHVSFIFLAILVLAQSLVFVAGQANPKSNYDFKAIFIRPVSYSSHQVGEKINLLVQADDKNINERSVIYIIVASPEKNIKLNFEASQQPDGTWSAVNIWDTDNWPTGIYQLSVMANIFDSTGQLQDTLVSDITLVQLVDLLLPDSSSNNQNTDNTVVISQVEDEALSVDRNNIVTTTSTSSTPALVNDNTSTNSTSTTTSTSTVSNVPAVVKHISLIVPTNNSTISQSSLTLKLTTNFKADSLSIELINADSAAISTGSLDIDKTDGLSWVKTIELNDTFIDGDYKLLATAVVPDNETVLEATFDLNLALPLVVKPEDIILSLTNPGNNLSGAVTLKAGSNKNINNLQFVFKDSITKTESLIVDGTLQSSNTSSGQQYIYFLDTKTLANGNYYLSVQSLIGDLLIKSESKIISIYNNENENSTSTAALSTSTEGLLTDDETVSGVSEPESGSIDCQKSGITDPVLCARYKAELTGQIPNLCLIQNIFTADACEQYLQENSATSLCQAQDLNNLSCQDFLISKYLTQVDCSALEATTCQSILRDEYLYRVSAAQKFNEQISAEVETRSGQNIKLQDLVNDLSVDGKLAVRLPLLKNENNIILAKAKASLALLSTEQLSVHNPAVIILDRDADLLPDDLELYYGTDSANPDSDNDGYLDGEEIKNGYNPAGTGSLIVARNVLDINLFAKNSLEQPTENSPLALDTALQVTKAETSANGLQLSGVASPDTWVNIYLYSSLPLLMSTKTDASGAWTYQLDQALSEGVHQAYVAINDSQGKLLAQSGAISFAVTNIVETPAAQVNNNTTTAPVVSASFWEKLPFNIYYVGGGFFLALFILGIILLLKRSRKIAQNALAEENLPIDNQIQQQ